MSGENGILSAELIIQRYEPDADEWWDAGSGGKHFSLTEAIAGARFRVGQVPDKKCSRHRVITLRTTYTVEWDSEDDRC